MSGYRPSDQPLACTLAQDDIAGRLDAWREVSAQTTRSEPIEGGVRHVLRPGTNLGALAELMAAEQTCCSFLALSLVVDRRGTALELHGPVEAWIDLGSGDPA